MKTAQLFTLFLLAVGTLIFALSAREQIKTARQQIASLTAAVDKLSEKQIADRLAIRSLLDTENTNTDTIRLILETEASTGRILRKTLALTDSSLYGWPNRPVRPGDILGQTIDAPRGSPTPPPLPLAPGWQWRARGREWQAVEIDTIDGRSVQK